MNFAKAHTEPFSGFKEEKCVKPYRFTTTTKSDLPANIFAEHEKAKAYKDSLGENGLFEQALRINELYMLDALGRH